jgi:hypothetical protein
MSGAQYINIVSFIKSVKRLYTVFSIDLDSIIASSLLMRIALEEGVEIYSAPFYDASKPYEPGSVVLLVKVLQRTPVSGVRTVQLEELVGKDPKIISSVTMHLVKELKKQIIISRYIDILSIISMLSLSRSSIYDRNLVEVHKNLLDEAIDKTLFSFIDTLRFFGYPKRDIVESITKTVDPYIVGVSLDYEGARKILETVGGSISIDEAKSKLIEIISSKLSSYCRSCEPLVGSKIVLKETSYLIDDVYEATYALYSYIDVQGVEPSLYLCLDSRVIGIAGGVFDYVSKYIKDVVDGVIEGAGIKRMIIKGVKIGTVDISTASRIPPLYTVHKILRAIGFTEDITLFTDGKEWFLPLPFIAPRWPYDKELLIEKGYVVFKSVQDVGEVFK